MSEPSKGNGPVVNSYNEWDPLEEAVVGVAEGTAVAPWHVALRATMPRDKWEWFRQHGGEPFPQRVLEAAGEELDNFARVLEDAGVTVRRPDVVDHTKPFSTPEWTSTGVYATFARDIMLVVGDQIIEAPMGWRSRLYSMSPYRRIVKDYWARGARWVAAPRPELPDEAFNADYDPDEHDSFTGPEDSVLREFEPTFDVGDFMRCGRDIFAQPSHVTNWMGIEWVRRHLGDEFRVHEVLFDDAHPMHVNATFLPLAPGKLLVNPERVTKVPDMFDGWDVLRAPEPAIPDDHPMYMSSKWVSINLLMLDPEHVFVEENETELIRALDQWGLEPIPVPFRNVYSLGGAFHCVVNDVRRRGGLEDYFS